MHHHSRLLWLALAVVAASGAVLATTPLLPTLGAGGSAETEAHSSQPATAAGAEGATDRSALASPAEGAEAVEVRPSPQPSPAAPGDGAPAQPSSLEATEPTPGVDAREESPTPASEAPTKLVEVELVGELRLTGGINGDVWAHGDHAYVGTWSAGCPGTGVKIVDISEPANPTLVGHLASHTGTSAEDIVVIRADTAAFAGDLLAVGLQWCGTGGRYGVEFWDVTDPASAQPLGYLQIEDTFGVHELHLIQRSDRILALLAVPYAEQRGAGGDFRIVDATNPRQPFETANWGAFSDGQISPGEARGTFPAVYGHSALASADGNTVYVSYWDAGVVILDISDPANPIFIGRTRYEPEEEGNAHSVAVSADQRLLIVADEHTDIAIPGIEVEGPPEVAGRYPAVDGDFTAPLSARLAAEAVHVGRACPEGTPPEGVVPADPLLADPAGKIVVVDRGECTFGAKVARLEAAGAGAVVVVNNVDGPPTPMGGPGTAGIPGVMIGKEDGERLKEALGSATVTIALGSEIVAGYDDWGYLRFYDISDPAEPRQISTYLTPNTATDPITGPQDDGHYSVHNPFLVGDLLYASWFSDGLRVLDVSDPHQPREIASFVPPAHPDPTGQGFNPDQPMVWGVFVQDDLVLLSDMNYGLYVLSVSEE